MVCNNHMQWQVLSKVLLEIRSSRQMPMDYAYCHENSKSKYESSESIQKHLNGKMAWTGRAVSVALQPYPRWSPKVHRASHWIGRLTSHRPACDNFQRARAVELGCGVCQRSSRKGTPDMHPPLRVEFPRFNVE